MLRYRILLGRLPAGQVAKSAWTGNDLGPAIRFMFSLLRSQFEYDAGAAITGGRRAVKRACGVGIKRRFRKAAVLATV